MTNPGEIISVPVEEDTAKDLFEQHEMADVVEPVKPKYAANNQMDEAAQLLDEAGGFIHYTPEDEKRVLRKIDLYVCVPMCIVYIIQILDKGCVGMASVFNLQEITHLEGSEYSWLSSCVYCAQFICQPISGYALVVFPVKYWVMFNFTVWSSITIATAACKNFTTLLICRTLLGMFEGTILPSFILITQMWWTRREQSFRTIAYQCASSLSSLFAPLLTYAVGKGVEHSNHIYAYQGIFLLIGGLSLFFVPIVWYLLPNSPTTATFLANGNDRLIAIGRLRQNNTGTKNSKFKWGQVKEAFLDPKTWIWGALWFCAACPSGGIGVFGGLITKGFGFNSFTTTLMQMPTGAIGLIVILSGITVTNRIKLRWPVIAFIAIFPVAGAIGMTQVPRDRQAPLMVCYYITFVFSGILPLLVSWCNLNASGTTKRVVTTSVMFTASSVGNIVGPQVYLKSQAPYYTTGLWFDIGCWSMVFLLVCFQGWYLGHLNKRQEARRAELGMPASIKDMSIMSTREATEYMTELTAIMQRSGFNTEYLNEYSFHDMTDFENPWFMYVL